MAQRALNRVQLIGNLTRDPELRYTPSGTAVCTFGLATNRTWTTETGDKKEDVEFHRLVAWNKLAEICSQLLFKGRRVYLDGRLQTRQWTGKDGVERQTTEVVIADMIILDSKRAPGGAGETDWEEPDSGESPAGEDAKTGQSSRSPQAADDSQKKSSDDDQENKSKTDDAQKPVKSDDQAETEVKPEDIPF
jgi:single-strand DNA-binding protein